MNTRLERVVLTSGNPENATAPHPGFVFCPLHSITSAFSQSDQEAIYRWAFASAKAQVAAARQIRRWHSPIDPSLN